MTLLIDGDMVGWLTSLHPNDSADRAVRWVRRHMEQLGGTRAIVCFSSADRRYFRHILFPGYKPKRSEPPEMYGVACDALRNTFTHRTLDGLEADDVMGILATHKAMKGPMVMVANDKDMMSIPGRHFNPQKQPHGMVEVSERDADFNHLWQTIVGDSGDGYPGCPGIGPQKAKKVLWGDPSLWWGQVVMAFKGKGRTEADALLQARLARICRASDFDDQTKTTILWKPGTR